jgi:hypothetical protein
MSENRSTTSGNFSAADLRRRMAERETAKAAEEMRRMKEQEEKQKAVMEEFRKPPARTPEQLMELIMQLVSRAAERGQSEVQIYRFQISCVATAAEGSITPWPNGKALWRVDPSSATNSGAIT